MENSKPENIGRGLDSLHTLLVPRCNGDLETSKLTKNDSLLRTNKTNKTNKTPITNKTINTYISYIPINKKAKEQKNFADDSYFSSNNQADLKLLSVLMSESDLTLIMSLKSKENVTRDELALLGDVILTNMRSYC